MQKRLRPGRAGAILLILFIFFCGSTGDSVVQADAQHFNITYSAEFSPDFSNLALEVVGASGSAAPISYSVLDSSPGEWIFVQLERPLNGDETLSILAIQQNASSEGNGSAAPQFVNVTYRAEFSPDFSNMAIEAVSPEGAAENISYSVVQVAPSEWIYIELGRALAEGETLNMLAVPLENPGNGTSNGTGMENGTGSGTNATANETNATDALIKLNVTYSAEFLPDFSNLAIQAVSAGGAANSISYSVLDIRTGEWVFVELGRALAPDEYLNILAIPFSNQTNGTADNETNGTAGGTNATTNGTNATTNETNATMNETNATMNETNATLQYQYAVVSRGGYFANVSFNGSYMEISEEVLQKLENNETVRVIAKMGANPQFVEGLAQINSYPSMKLYIFQITNGEVGKLVAAGFEKVYLDREMHASLSDSVKLVGADSAQREFNASGSGVAVCMLDTANETSDDNGHGTAMASIISAMAPGASIIPIKVLDSLGAGYSSDAIGAISSCVEQSKLKNIKVIFIGFGGGSFNGSCGYEPVSAAAEYAVSDGLMIVAPSGNDGSYSLNAPACAENATAVASSTKSDEISAFSNVNPAVALLAPGENLTVPVLGENQAVSGTSAAAAHVAGAAALLFEKNPGLSPKGAEDILKATGVPVERDGISYPRIDIFAALNSTMNISAPVENATEITFVVQTSDGVPVPATVDVQETYDAFNIGGGQPSLQKSRTSFAASAQEATTLRLKPGRYTVTVQPSTGGKVKKLTINGYEVGISPSQQTITISDAYSPEQEPLPVDAEAVDGEPVAPTATMHYYSITFSGMNFTNASALVSSESSALYKCGGVWDGAANACNGKWFFSQYVGSSGEYSVGFTPDINGFREGMIPGADSRPDLGAPEKFYVDGVEYSKPQVYRPMFLDEDGNGLRDSLEYEVSKSPDKEIGIIVTTYGPVTDSDISDFESLGGKIRHIYSWAGYGYAGTIRASAIPELAAKLGSNLCLAEEDVPVEMNLDHAMRVIMVRPTVWQTYGYMGSANNSIASLDTGADPTHADTLGYINASSAGWGAVGAQKIVGWADMYGENNTPVAIQGHGAHTSSIAVGTGTAYGNGSKSNITVTFEGDTYTSSPAAYSQRYYLPSAGIITINYSIGGASGNRSAYCLFPNMTAMANMSGPMFGSSEPLVVKYNATVSGVYTCYFSINSTSLITRPFSALINFPYQGVGDGYNLFTGVAPQNKLVAVKIMDNSGSGFVSDMEAGYDWVVANKAAYHIKAATTSITLGGASSPTTDAKANAIVENGIPFSISSGNGFCLVAQTNVGSPSVASKVISVGATDYYDQISYYSSNGAAGSGKPDVVAPGGGLAGPSVCSADSNFNDADNASFAERNINDSGYFMGTSASAPQAGGLLALMEQAWENSTNSSWSYTEDSALRMKQIMLMTAWETNKLGEYCSVWAVNNSPTLNRGGKDLVEGFGRINADAAIEAITMSYGVGTQINVTLNGSEFGKKVWARKMQLSPGTTYNFNLSVPSTADFDMYLYYKDYDTSSPSIGDPIIYQSSVNAGNGVNESFSAQVPESGTYYLVVKDVNGTGAFSLSSLGAAIGGIAGDAIIAYRSNTSFFGLNSPKIRFWNASGAGSWSSEMELPSAGSPVRYAVVKWSPASRKVALVTLSDNGNLTGYVCPDNCSNASNWAVSPNIGNVWSSAPAVPSRKFDMDFETSTGNLVLVYAILDASTTHDLAYRVLPLNQSNFSATSEAYIDDAGHGTDITYNWTRTARNPASGSREIIVTGFDSTDSDINSWVWNGSAWGNQIDISNTATSTGGYEALAVAYDNESKAMSIGGDGTVGIVNWRQWNGTAWTAVSSFTVTSTNRDVRWIGLKADPVSSKMQGVFVDSGPRMSTAYWNGSAWATTIDIDTAVDSGTTRCADFEWNRTGSVGKLVWDTDGAGTTLSQRDCSPQCTAGTTTFSTYAGTGAWLTLYRNPSSSSLVNMLNARLNSAFDIGSFTYNGTGYNNYGDTAITNTTTVSTFESYSIAFNITDSQPPSINFTSPTSPSGATIYVNYTYINTSITDNSGVSLAYLEWNGTANITMNSASNSNWYYNQIGLASGTYSYRVFASDYAGNWNVSETRTITIDTLPPTITFVAPTPANGSSRSVNWAYINITANENLTSALLEWNGTNQSMSGSGTSWFINKTGLADGLYSYKVYGNDSGNNWGASGTYTVSIGTVGPAWSNPQANQTPVYWNQSVTFNTSWTDGSGLSGYIFSINQSGWSNSSFTQFGGAANLSQNVSPITANAGTNVSWYFWANDSAGNSNQTAMQTFVVQARPTALAFGVNQTNYPSGSNPGNGYDVYIPFQARYTDVLSGQPIAAGSCNVTNSVTSVIVGLAYNSSTGNYTGQISTHDLYDLVTFNTTCAAGQNYNNASNSTNARVTLYYYLWDWNNYTIGPSNYSSVDWLRKPPPTGPIVNITKDMNASAGPNLVGEFYFYGFGANGTFSRDIHIVGLHTIRLNVSVNDTACKPYITYTVQDANLNVLYEEGVNNTPPQSVPANTPSPLEYNFTNNFTIMQGQYFSIRYYLNCSSVVPIRTSAFFNDSILRPNFEAVHGEPSLIASRIASYDYPANYTIGPQGMLNVTRHFVVAFNNTGSTSAYLIFQFFPQILSIYPNSHINNTAYVYNSTGALWASDNASAGAPHAATSFSDNSMQWQTEEIHGLSELTENLTRGVLNAIRDNETLVASTPSVKSWNITVFDVFVPQLTISNVTVWTNYSTYGAQDGFSFQVSMTNSSGTFDISSQVIKNTTAKTLTFPAADMTLGSLNYTIYATNTTAPSITFVFPTPDNDTTRSANWSYVNITSDANLTSAILEWNGTNQSMSGSGTNWFTNKSGLADGLYAYKVYGNDSSNNIGVSETRTITIDTTPPVITFVNITPANGSVRSVDWAYINITSNENLSEAILEWNGTNQSMSGSGTNWFINKSGLALGAYSYKVYGNDSVNNWGVSETRTLYYAFPPSVIILSPLGEAHYQGGRVSLSVNATDPFGIDTGIAQVAYPNGSVSNFTLYRAQQGDNFSSNTVGTNWFKENVSIGPSQTCVADINATYAGKAFTSLSGNGGPETDTLCSLIAAKPMDGDFDISISFNITGETGSDNALNFEAIERNSSATADELVFISLSNWTGLGRNYEIYLSGENFSDYIYRQPTEDTYGKLRIVRSANNFAFYIWNNTNDSWYLANSTSMSICRPLYPAFESESALPAWGAMNVTWDDFSAQGNGALFRDLGDTLQLGLYNVTFFVNNTLGSMNNSEKTNFTVFFENQPPTTPFILTPSVGSVVSGMQNITWSNVFDYENDLLNFNITLLNPDGSDNAAITFNYGDINSTSYPWNTSLFPDGEYSMRVTVFENETPEQLSNSYTLPGTFFIHNNVPSVVILSPLGESHYQGAAVSLSVNVSSLFPISLAIAQVTYPNGSAVNVTLHSGQHSDNFSADTVGADWFKENKSIGPSQACIADINATYAGQAYTSLTGSGAPESDTFCSLISAKPLDADFDVSISFNLTSGLGADSAINFQLLEGNSSADARELVFMSLSNWTGLGRNYEIYLSGENFSDYILRRPTDDTFGKFRITRAGDNFTFYTWNYSSSSWSYENSTALEIDRPLYISFESESALPAWGSAEAAWDDLSVQDNNATFAAFAETLPLGLYNVTFFVNDTLGAMNDSENTNFTVFFENQPPTTPFILTPSVGSVVSGMQNITWSEVFDIENDALWFNITLLNPGGTDNATITFNYGDINSTSYPWNTSLFPDGEYSMRVTVFENETPGQLSNSYMLPGTFFIDNNPPLVTVISPLGENYSERRPVSISINATDLYGISSAIAQITMPNGTAVNLTLGKGQQGDNFSSDSVDVNWTKEDVLVGPSQTCIADIDTTILGKAYTSISGDGTPLTDTLCSLVSKGAIDGDFDIAIDFSIENETGIDHAFEFQITRRPTSATASRTIFIALSNWTGFGRNYEIFADDGNFSGYILTRETNDTSGKMRIKRVTDIFTFYTWNSSANDWTEENVSQNSFDFARAVYVSFESESVYPGWGNISVSWDNFSVNGSNNTFGMFNSTSQLGLYNVSFFVNDTHGLENNSERTNFTIIHFDTPPSTPYLLAPFPGEFASGMYNITWSGVNDFDGDSLQFNITLLNPDGTYNATLASGYGDINSTAFEWNTSLFDDGNYSMEIVVFENETPEGLSNSYILLGNFTIDNNPPSIQFEPPTEISGATLYRNYILVNVSSSDANLNVIEIYLYNSTGSLINQTYSSTSPFFANFTSLPEGVYYFNATALDSFAHQNSTETRNVTLSSQGCVGSSAIFRCGDSVTQSCTLNTNLSAEGASCLAVAADDVKIDCNGYSLTGNGSGIGIFTNRLNTTVRDCTLGSFDYDMALSGSAASTIINITFHTPIGLLVNGTNDTSYYNLTFSNITEKGIYITGDSNNNAFTNITMATESSAHGIYVDGGSNSSFDCAGGAIVGTNSGTERGIYSSSPSLTVKDCVVSNYTYGAYLLNDAALIGDRYYGNTYALMANASGGPFALNLTNVIFDASSGAFENFTNLSLYDGVDSGTYYYINWSAEPAPLPPFYTSFRGKFLDINDEASGSIIDSITWNWDDSELTGYNENYFELWNHETYSGMWNLRNNTPDASANTLSISSLNLSMGAYNDYRTFGILLNNLTECPVITAPGNYIAVSDLTGAPNNASEIYENATACIKINSDNVVFDCNGHSITGNNSENTTFGAVISVPDPMFGLMINNVTLVNCVVSNYTYGIYAYYWTTNITIVNNTLYNNTIGLDVDSGQRWASEYLIANNTAFNNSAGFQTEGNYFGVSNIANNTAFNNSFGFNLTNIFWSNITSCLAYNNSGTGFHLLSSSHNSVNTSAAYNNANGFVFEAADQDFIFNNTAYNNSESGFYVGSIIEDYWMDPWWLPRVASVQNQFLNNTAYGNAIGLFANTTSGPVDNLYENNTAYNNSLAGFYFNQTSYNTLVNNSAYNNTLYGFYLGSGDEFTANLGEGGFYDWGNATNNIYIENAAYNNANGFYLYSTVASDDYLLYTLHTNTLTNNSAYNNSERGYSIFKGTNHTLSLNMGINNTQYGIILTNSPLNYLNLDNITESQYGIALTNYSFMNTLSYEAAWFNSVSGFLLDFSGQNLLDTCQALSNGETGFHLNVSAQNNLSYCTAQYNGETGFLFNVSDNNTVEWPLADTNNAYGMYLGTSNGNNFTSATVQSQQFGFYLLNSTLNRIEGSAVSNSSNSGIYIEGGNTTQYEAVANISAYINVSQTAYTFTPIDISGATQLNNGDTASDYGNYTMRADDEAFTYDLPFTFPYMGRNITSISANTNGMLELLESGETQQFDGWLGVHAFNPYAGLADIIFISNDDLQTFDNPPSTYMAVINLGDRVVVEWNGSTFADYAYFGGSSTNPIHFQAVLYPNGTVEWNYENMSFANYSADMFSGAYAKEENTEFTAGYAISNQSSYAYDFNTTLPPFNGSVFYTGALNTVASNDIFNNTNGILINASNTNFVDGNTIHECSYGVFSNDANSTRITYNALSANGFGVWLAGGASSIMNQNNISYNTNGGLTMDSVSSGSALQLNYICFNDHLDVNNSNPTNNGSADSCDYFNGWTEDGHGGCTYACTSLWQRFFGNVSGEIVLTDANTTGYVHRWDARGFTVYFTDYDSIIDWQALQAIGRDTANGTSSSDFEELDVAFNTTVFNDSINHTYSTDGTNPIETANYTVFGKGIAYVPVANSTLQSTAFKTGILWDTSDGGSEYSNVYNQSTVWMVRVNASANDTYGVYDYLIQVPYTLATYEGSNNVVAVYLELQ